MSSLESALQGVQVVISTLRISGAALQPALAKAAKRAGASLFVPSEFGNPTSGKEDHPFFGAKARLHAFHKEIPLIPPNWESPLGSTGPQFT